MQSKTTLNKYKQDTIKRALSYIAEEMRQYSGDSDKAVTQPKEARNLARLLVGGSPRELFGVMFLDNQHRLIESEITNTGTIDGASIYPREIVKRALFHNAAAVIFTHNHPSGVAEPSGADERITTRLVNALQLIDVRVLDHLIIGRDSTVSFAERGLL
jgi:DNA repair protein RadC